MSRPVTRCTLALLLCTVLGGLAAAQGITPEQVMKLRRVLGVLASPDGSKVAFTRTQPRSGKEAAGGSRAHLFMLDASGERRILQTTRGAAFSPDGRSITFVQTGPGDDHAEVWALPLDGGEAVKVTTTPHGVSSYRWRPDGSGIAYTATDAYEKTRAKARGLGFRPIIVDEDYRHISLWYWNEADGRCSKLTEGASVYDFRWSPKGDVMVAAIAPRNLVDDSYMAKRLHVVTPAGEVRKLIDNPGKLGDIAFSPDGKRVAYISAADKRDPHAGMLFVIGIDGGEAKALTPGFKGMVHHLEWMENDRIHAAVSIGVHTRLVTIDAASGAQKTIFEQEGLAFRSFTPGADGTFWCAASTARHPEEAYRIDVDAAAGTVTHTRRTESNPLLKDVKLGRQEVVKFAARDRVEIEGLLHYPVGYEEGKRYPMVIVAHGGPESHFSNGWNTSYGRWGQLLCAKGWFAWYPNYRASTGYGVEFAKADHGDPMGGEFRDHLDAIDHFVERGLVDRARVGIGGGSYGGYTAAWAATRHSKQFAAAVSFVPFVDIRTKWYTSDIPNEFYLVHYEEKWPHEQRHFLSERSPLTWAPGCTTPLLLLGGTADPRVHPSQPFMLYRAVKTATKTPVRYVQYAGEGHGNRSDVNQYDYCLRTLRWFEHYLRPGDHRKTAPPAWEVDYSKWRAW